MSNGVRYSQNNVAATGPTGGHVTKRKTDNAPSVERQPYNEEEAVVHQQVQTYFYKAARWC